MDTTRRHRHFFQPYAPWLIAAVVVVWLASCSPIAAQCPFFRWPTAEELADWTAKRKAAEHARWAPIRARQAREVLARTKTRAAKLERRIKGWRDEIGKPYRGLSGRLRKLQAKSRAVRNSTMRRNLGTLVETVRRKIAQREEWIKRARKDLGKIEIERAAALRELSS